MADARALIESALQRTLDEVPVLQPLKLVIGLELRGGRDVQFYRVQLPGPQISKDVASDARVRLEVERATFNVLAEKGTIRDWRRAFEKGEAKATGVEQIIRLVAQVVERQEERTRLRRARH